MKIILWLGPPQHEALQQRVAAWGRLRSPALGPQFWNQASPASPQHYSSFKQQLLCQQRLRKSTNPSQDLCPASPHSPTQNTLFLPIPQGLWKKRMSLLLDSSFSLLDLVFRRSGFSEWLRATVIHLPGFPEFMWHSHRGSDYSGFPPLASLTHQYCQYTHFMMPACRLDWLVCF